VKLSSNIEEHTWKNRDLEERKIEETFRAMPFELFTRLSRIQLDMASQSFEDLASDASSGTINTYHSRFEPELNLRGLCFADEEVDKYPLTLDHIKSAVFAARGSDEVDAKNFRKRIRKAPNESATV